MKTEEVAEILKLSPRRVRALAQRRQVGRKMPWGYEFSGEDIKKLRPGPYGRPSGRKISEGENYG